MAVWFVRDLKLSHQVVELTDGNPSIIRFSIHPNSTHFEKWTKGPYHVLQNRTQILVGSKVVEIDEEQFKTDYETSSTRISHMLLPCSLRIVPGARDLLLWKITIETYFAFGKGFII